MKIPNTILFGDPDKTNPQISPDGTMIAFIAPFNEVLNIFLWNLEEPHYRNLTSFESKRDGIWWFKWLEDNQHIIYKLDSKGNENWQLFCINIFTKEIKNLTPFENVQIEFLSCHRNYPDRLFILMNKEIPTRQDLYCLNVIESKIELIFENTGNIIDWLFDLNCNLKGILTANDDGISELLVLKNNRWVKFLKWLPEDNLTKLICTNSEVLFYIDAKNSNTSSLKKINLKSRKIEVLASDNKYDISEVLINPNTLEVEAVSYNKERKYWHSFNKTTKNDIKKLKSMEIGDFFICNQNQENSKWLVCFISDRKPISYYLYDRKEKKLLFLFFDRTQLINYELQPMNPISFTSRDGYEIHGYITFPKIKTKKMPMVLKVHGGPWSRVNWGFDTEAQWIANCDYICLQINYRGSTGYGKDFLNAGNKEWGGKMQDDLVDAVHWAINNGYVDETRIAIYGSSYGGYAALVGASYHPSLFCCAVDLFGPSNLINLIQSIPPYWTSLLNILHNRIGNPETDMDLLRSRSPFYMVKNITIPILIAQGNHDPRVKMVDTQKFMEELKNNNVKFDFILFPEEGHSLNNPNNRIKLCDFIEIFLMKNLKREGKH